MYTREGLSEAFNYLFSYQAADVIRSTRDEAIKLNHNPAGIQHLLLGLTRNNVFPLTLKGITFENVRPLVKPAVRTGHEWNFDGFSFSSEFWQEVTLSVDRAKKKEVPYILPEDLLMVVCEQKDIMVVGILEALNIPVATLDEIANQINRDHSVDLITQALNSLGMVKQALQATDVDELRKQVLARKVVDTAALVPHRITTKSKRA